MNARRLVLSSFATALGVLVCAGAPALASAAEAPKVEEAFVTRVASTSATLHAQVSPGGTATTYAFEYAAGGGFKLVPEAGGSGSLPEGTAGVALSVHVQGLLPSTSYEFRLVASNSAGTATGGSVSFVTERGGGEFTLPDGREYEMVSPPQKQGSLLMGLFGEESNGVDYLTEHITVQASVGGNAIVDEADQPTESESQGDANGVSVFMARGSSGWSPRVIAPPHSGEAVGVKLGTGGEYRFFSEDLSRGVVQQFGSFTPLSPEAVESTPYLHTDYLNGNVDELCSGSSLGQGSCFEPLVTRGDTAPGTVFGDAIDGGCDFGFCGPLVIAATPDLSHVILASRRRLTATPVRVKNFEQSITGPADYEWYAGRLQLLNILPGKEEGGGSGVAVGDEKHVVSNNGGRVLLEGYYPPNEEIRPDGLYLRDVAKGETVRLDAVEAGCGACASGEGAEADGAEYVKANSEDSRVFFLDVHKLTRNAAAYEEGNGLKRSNLYECEIVEVAGRDRCNLSDLTPETGGEAGTARAVLGASEDGSYVYFVAGARLAPGAPSAEKCEIQFEPPGPCNLYVRHNGVTSFIAELTGKDRQYYRNNSIELSEQRTRVSLNGRWLAFMSDGDLTGYDTRDAVSGVPDEEVYLYNASSNTLACASCDPTGARPVGINGPVASAVPGWVKYTGGAFNNGPIYQTRYLSNSGRLFFDSKDALVPLDVNGAVDVYEYEPEGVPAGEHACGVGSGGGSVVFKPVRGFEVEESRRGEEGAGCVALISSGASPEASTFLDASETGGDVFFMTTSKLASQDFDHAYDIYDAQECTSVVPCAPAPVEQPPPCETEGSCRAAPPPQPSIYGVPSSATFNGTGNLAQASPSPAALHIHAKRAAKCRKGFVKRNGRCVRVRSKRARRARAGNERRGK